MLGMVLRQKGDLPEAKAAFEKAEALTPENFQATEQLIELDILTKDLSKAHERVQKLIEQKPDFAGGHFLLGRIYAIEGAWARAQAELLKTIDLDASLSRAYDLLISTYVASGNLPEAINRLEAKLAKKPDDQSSLLSLAVIYEKTSAFPKAREAYEKLLALNPDFVPALNNLAVLFTDQFNQLDKAEEFARKARTLRPDDPSVADTLGWILYKRADYNQAMALFSESARKMPDSPEVQFHLGMASYMMGKTEEARTALQKAVASPSDFSGKEEARKRLALLGSDSGKPAQLSAQELEALVKAQPNDLVTKVRLGEAYEAEGAFPKAATTYEEALKLNPKHAPAMLKLAQLNLGPLPNAAKALDLAKKARAITPNDPKVSEILGRASYQTGSISFAYSLLLESSRQPAVDAGTLRDFAWAAYSIGKITQAQETIQRLVKEAPDSPEAGDARNFLAMTALAETGKDLAAAEPEVQKILAAKPDYLPARMVLAALQTQRGDSKAAEATYAAIVGKFPEFAPAQKQLAAIYLGTPSNRDKAYSMAMKARVNLPEDPGLARTLGELSYHRKDFANAIRFFDESAKAQPLDANGLWYLGLSYAKAQDKEKAADALRRALDAGLKEPLAAEATRTLGELAK
jgi:tetratricopeptide (TPR) repeat protein